MSKHCQGTSTKTHSFVGTDLHCCGGKGSNHLGIDAADLRINLCASSAMVIPLQLRTDGHGARRQWQPSREKKSLLAGTRKQETGMATEGRTDITAKYLAILSEFSLVVFIVLSSRERDLKGIVDSMERDMSLASSGPYNETASFTPFRPGRKRSCT